MIKIDNLTKSIDEQIILENLSCEISDGSIYGLIGHNGAGKTTLLRLLSGVYTQNSGDIYIDDQSIVDNERVKRNCYFLPDDPYFFPNSTLKSMGSFHQGFYPQWSWKIFNKLVDLFELHPKKRINSFSKGMKRQAAIILALAASPQYMFLDESFDGLDPEKRNMVRLLLNEYMAEKGSTIIISTHNLRELEDLCDTMGLLKNKKIQFNCSIEDVRKNRCKIRVGFQESVSPDIFNGFDIKDLKISGKIATFISHEGQEEAEKRLYSLNPALIEVLPLTLEEIFLDEMEVKKYELKEIFQ